MQGLRKGEWSAITKVKVLSPEICLIVALGQGFLHLEARSAARDNGECVSDVPGSKSIAGHSTVLSGILTIAIADAFSDAMGIHISEESENKHFAKEIWESTISTFLSKFVLALTFIIPLFLFKLSTAIIVAVAWGISLLTAFSFLMAKRQKKKVWKVVGEHLVIASIVILATHYIGHFCQSFLG